MFLSYRLNHPLRIAVIHDAFLDFGGAERVVFSLLSMFPSADVFSLVVDWRNNLYCRQLGGHIVRTSGFQRFLPYFRPKPFWILRLFASSWWEAIDLSGYDLVITSSDSYGAYAVLTPPSTIHLAYVHSPPAYLYNEDIFFGNNSQSFIREILFHELRKQDFIEMQRPNILVANSEFTRRRIQKYYKRDARVIYPPVDVISNKIQETSDKDRSYYVTVSRLEPSKGVDLAIRACSILKRKLLVIGKGPGGFVRYLRGIAGPTIQFLGFVPDEKMDNIYAGAKAQICCYLNEDFGLSSVEAMAHGVPVIGHRSGGLKEIIIEGKTGVVFDQFNTGDVVAALKKFESIHTSYYSCVRSANRFSSERFRRRVQAIIQRGLLRTPTWD